MPWPGTPFTKIKIHSILLTKSPFRKHIFKAPEQKTSNLPLLYIHTFWKRRQKQEREKNVKWKYISFSFTDGFNLISPFLPLISTPNLLFIDLSVVLKPYQYRSVVEALKTGSKCDKKKEKIKKISQNSQIHSWRSARTVRIRWRWLWIRRNNVRGLLNSHFDRIAICLIHFNIHEKDLIADISEEGEMHLWNMN